jgi:hypothetical protein
MRTTWPALVRYNMVRVGSLQHGPRWFATTWPALVRYNMARQSER